MKTCRLPALFLLLMCLLQANVGHAQKNIRAEQRFTDKPDTFRRQVYNLVNLKRSIYSLPPLHLNDTLNQLASEHSLRMSKDIVPLGHDGFEARESHIRSQWANVLGVGENVVAAASPEEAVDLWWNSQGHQDNIIGVWQAQAI